MFYTLLTRRLTFQPSATPLHFYIMEILQVSAPAEKLRELLVVQLVSGYKLRELQVRWAEPQRSTPPYRGES